jgi:hypothetical protein
MISEWYVAAMGLMKLVEYHPDYVEERDSQKARAVNLVFHSRINSVVKINIYVSGTGGGDVESMIPVGKIS